MPSQHEQPLRVGKFASFAVRPSPRNSMAYVWTQAIRLRPVSARPTEPRQTANYRERPRNFYHFVHSMIAIAFDNSSLQL
jgi:hypothetical protein